MISSSVQALDPTIAPTLKQRLLERGLIFTWSEIDRKFSPFFDMSAGVSVRRRCEIAGTKMTGRTINDHNPVVDRLAVSPAEAARLAGIGRTTIYEAIGSGALRSVKTGKRRLILISSLRD